MGKKLLQINATANWGSTGRIAEQINLLAMEHGWDCYIAYGRNCNPSRSKLIRVGGKLNPYIHFAKQYLLDSEGLNSNYATKQLIKKIQTMNPDIIHLHNIHDHWLNYRILFEYLNNTNIKIVWTFHDCWAFTGGCAHFTSLKCNKWQEECKNCPMKKCVDNSQNNFKLKRDIFTSNPNLTIVPVSKWLEKNIKNSFFNKNRIIHISNGVDIDAFHPIDIKKKVIKSYKIDDKFLLVGLATAWSVQKGLNDYIELAEHLNEDYVVMLVGLKKNQVPILPKNVIAIERISDIKELVELYSTADIVLNLSYQETFGLTTIEGFACGTPGIVYNKTASPELIEGDIGYVVEAGNIEQLLSAIEVIKNKGKEYYSNNCRQRAVEFYDKNKCFEKYINLYNELLNEI